MKTLAQIKIGNINALLALKAITIICLTTYLILVIKIGFFTIPAFITFLLTVALFLLCTHKPKANNKKHLNMFSKNQMLKYRMK